MGSMLGKVVNNADDYVKYVIELMNVLVSSDRQIGSRTQTFFRGLIVFVLSNNLQITDENRELLIQHMEAESPRKGKPYQKKDIDRFMGELEKKEWIATSDVAIEIPENFRSMPSTYLINVEIDDTGD